MSRILPRFLVVAGFGLTLSLSQAHAQQPPQQPEGVEVQTRGPIHEAFAEPVDGQPAPTHIVNREPPAPIEEQPPDQRPAGEHVQWIGGYWAWDDARNDYLWVSGFWRTPPPGRTWVAGSWRAGNGGFQWVAGYWAPVEKTEQQYLPPPPASVESGPTVPAPSHEHVYVPGSWYYSGDHYVWRPGVWVEYRPGWVWIPAHYRWTPAGYVFIDGYWDFPLRERGLLFAPVYISPAVAYRPGWYYSPSFVVYDNALYGAMFVRAGSTHYYFGDYFEARFTSVGYHSWFSVSFGRSYAYDPLFSYYRFTYRNDPYWEPAMREVYVARYAGDLPRPPVTLALAININSGPTIVNNTTIVNKYTNINRSTTINNVTNITNVNNVGATLTQINNNTTVNNTTNNNIKLQQVTPAQKQQFVQTNQQLQNVAKQRQQTETQMVSSGHVPTKAGDAPKSVPINTVKPAGTTLSNAATGAHTSPTNVTPHTSTGNQPSNPSLSNNPPRPPLANPPNQTAPSAGVPPKSGVGDPPSKSAFTAPPPNNTLNGNNGQHPSGTGYPPPPGASPYTPGTTKGGTVTPGNSPNGPLMHQSEKDKKKEKEKKQGDGH